VRNRKLEICTSGSVLPVLDAVIAKKPDAILIAPTDKVQLVEPLRKANSAGIPVITVDTFIGFGRVLDGRRQC
jgi:ribose transport system substrate-binding protein